MGFGQLMQNWRAHWDFQMDVGNAYLQLTLGNKNIQCQFGATDH